MLNNLNQEESDMLKQLTFCLALTALCVDTASASERCAQIGEEASGFKVVSTISAEESTGLKINSGELQELALGFTEKNTLVPHFLPFAAGEILVILFRSTAGVKNEGLMHVTIRGCRETFVITAK